MDYFGNIIADIDKISNDLRVTRQASAEIRQNTDKIHRMSIQIRQNLRWATRMATLYFAAGLVLGFIVNILTGRASLEDVATLYFVYGLVAVIAAVGIITTIFTLAVRRPPRM